MAPVMLRLHELLQDAECESKEAFVITCGAPWVCVYPLTSGLVHDVAEAVEEKAASGVCGYICPPRHPRQWHLEFVELGLLAQESLGMSLLSSIRYI